MTNVQINIVKCNNVVKVVVCYIVLLKTGQQKLKENSFPLLAILESSVQLRQSPSQASPVNGFNEFIPPISDSGKFSSVQFSSGDLPRITFKS